MIGIIGTVLLKFIERRFGKETLNEILKKGGLSSIDDVDPIRAYDDADTFAVVGICLEVTKWSLHDLMEAFGDFFVVWAVEAGYDKMLMSMANNLHDFLDNLNFMHYFINQCSFRSEMRGPNFKCIQLDEVTLQLNYISRRRGLNALVLGLVYRAARVLFDIEITIGITTVTEYARGENATDIHTIYRIRLDTAPPHSCKTDFFTRPKKVDHALIESADFPLKLRDFNQIFPCHICFDRDLIIQHVGVFLLNEYNLANKRVHLEDVVELLQPTAAQMSFASFLENANTRFIVRMKLAGNRAANKKEKPVDLILSGQMQLLESGNSIVYLCSPYANTVRQLLDTSHYLADIPMRDATRVLVMLNQSRMWQLDRNKRLEEACRSQSGRESQLLDVQDRNRRLLYLHVPSPIGECLYQGKSYEPQSYSEATVLACSLPDFNAITDYCSPREVIDLLADLSNRFDRLIEMRKLYLVHSFSDSWLVVGGAPDRSRTDHTAAVLDLAIGMIAEARQIEVAYFGLPLRLRVGVAMGAVSAMVISERRPKFFIYGDPLCEAKALCAVADPEKCLVSNSVRTSVTKTLCSVYVFSSKGYVDAGERKLMSHYLERNERLSPVQIVDREGETIFFRDCITTEEAETWDRHSELATRAEHALRSGSLSLGPRLLSKSWRCASDLVRYPCLTGFRSTRSDDSGISEGERTVKSLPSQWDSRSCVIS